MSEKMTREQARDTLRNAAWLGTNEDRERIERAVELLCGEPCEDVISQSDVIDAIGSWMDSGENCLRGNAERYLIDRIKALPPVTPKQRTGHWIECEDEVKVYCSECKEISDYPTNYCSNCGAKMVEPQESCDTCKHKDKEWDSEHCDGCCGNHSGFEPQEGEKV